MAVRTAVVGDTVQYRDTKGRTRNALVLALQGAAPTTPGVAQSGTGGTLGAATYSYKYTAIVGGVESAPSAAGSTVVASGTTNKTTITMTAVTGATAYNIYGRTSGSWLFIATVTAPTVTYDDTGSVTPAGAIPTADARVGLWYGRVGNKSVTALKATAKTSTNAYFLR